MNWTGQKTRIYMDKTGWAEAPLSKPLFEPAIIPVQQVGGIGERQNPKCDVHPSDPRTVCRVVREEGVPQAVAGRRTGHGWGIAPLIVVVLWSLRMRDN